ncbi:hypothetical protein AAG570_010424 [Ranatra chinensis]|uniref:SUEL-type lectin domain-containing protein n=1 Tax=Ranatra chinensis TaxID=642074 RepID=A0ABD0YPN1_9HEMI
MDMDHRGQPPSGLPNRLQPQVVITNMLPYFKSPILVVLLSLASFLLVEQAGSERVVVCENDGVTIECNPGNLIDVKSGRYGAPAPEKCLHRSVSPGPPDNHRPVRCQHPDSIDLLKSINGVFTVVCHLLGGAVWVEVYVTSRDKPKPVRSNKLRARDALVFVSNLYPLYVQQMLKVPMRIVTSYTTLTVANSRYRFGSTNSNRRRRIRVTLNSPFMFQITLKIVDSELQCQNKEKCQVKATNDVFRDPCRGTPKVLEFVYVCVEDSKENEADVP